MIIPSMLRLADLMDRVGQYDLADRMERVAGEYWFTDSGDVLGADGDIGDYNHERHVIEKILYDNDIDPDEEDWQSMSKEELMGRGLDPEEVACVRGTMDAREYAIRHWGWGRVMGDHARVRELTPTMLRNLANGWYDAYDEDARNRTYNIEVGEPGRTKYYSGIPWEAIDAEDPAALIPYRPI